MVQGACHGASHARLTGSLSLLRGSSPAGNGTQVFCVAGGFFTSWATREARRNSKELSKDSTMQSWKWVWRVTWAAWWLESLLKMQLNSKFFNPNSEKRLSCTLLSCQQKSGDSSLRRAGSAQLRVEYCVKNRGNGENPSSFWKGAPRRQSSSSPWLVDFERYFFFKLLEKRLEILFEKPYQP